MRKLLPRFSLLTAIVLMFAAGILIWLNVRRLEFPKEEREFQDFPDPPSQFYDPSSSPEPKVEAPEPFFYVTLFEVPVYLRGWPMRCYDPVTPLYGDGPRMYGPDPKHPLAYKYAALNLAIALAILAAVGIISEFTIRRIYRARRPETIHVEPN